MVEKHVVLETTCDGCGKVEHGEPDDWAHFSSRHDDWGNDSIESSRPWDACSGACYLAVLAKIVEDYGEPSQPTLEVDYKSYAFARDLLRAAGLDRGRSVDVGDERRGGGK